MSQRYARPVSYAAINPDPSGIQIGITSRPGRPGSGVPIGCCVPMSHEAVLLRFYRD
jgi:hypothetical protein